jgi:hypothetical protein
MSQSDLIIFVACLLAIALVRIGRRRPTLSRHIRVLRKRLDSYQFVVCAAPPYAVVSDEKEEDAKARIAAVAPWVADRLTAFGFKKSPHPITTVWLFRDWGN